MKNKVQNILLVGVGGQGILLASEILSEVLMLGGYDVKKAEVHGMAQRGGSVVSHVRYGEKVYSPIIPEGQADILFGFELLESYRYLPLLKTDGQVVASDLQIVPPGVALGKESYPEDVPAKIKAAFPRSRIVNAMALAQQAGNMRTVNTVLLGALSNMMDIPEEAWNQAMNNRVPAKFLEENLNAFALGRQA
ncbi:indolepyruvate oxidoreductase subunit beta [Geoalkalibacter halelectricus]|uniref:Indolepyruvate oxidoreductase subunit beta n=1 Tax=Geoalkalibacter halelectricus TaxID=2847045 RepID=A0ABY5ZRJ9_9BACT|nr:indolepyruvate oxidoreductase subunit beta [Geoalkalibacter halelectricus]MDO3379943.1 indolepyruvate oxidoreductase subunit beta [Geoalkalibacter halelectricus]UWZ80530.1 indolepyruvate oxidoreductase subunit beta [Geoalkalibacter halelectricus]